MRVLGQLGDPDGRVERCSGARRVSLGKQRRRLRAGVPENLA